VTSPVTPDPTSEPVLIAHAATVILGALVSLGWVAIPDTTINLIGTVAALIVSTVGVVVARGRVTPLIPGGVDANAVRLLVAEIVRTELGTLAAYRSATDTPPAPQAPSDTAALHVDWMGRPQ
jgi:hypothetical protein